VWVRWFTFFLTGVRGSRRRRAASAAKVAELRLDAAQEGRGVVERPRQLLLVPDQHPAVGVLESHVITGVIN
jgi:hypothetical protein